MPSRIVFLTEPRFQRAGAGHFKLCDPLDVRVNDMRFRVPTGFVTDGASIPKWVEWLVVAFLGHQYAPSVLRAAILHDWMCRNPHLHGLTSRRVHEIFHEALLADSVAPARAWCLWKAVAWFGPRWR